MIEFFEDGVYGCGTIGSGNGIGIRKNAGAEDPVAQIAHHKTAVLAVSVCGCGPVAENFFWSDRWGCKI